MLHCNKILQALELRINRPTVQIIAPKGGDYMSEFLKLIKYQKMAAADAARLLDARQLKDYLEKRHPVFTKKEPEIKDTDYNGPL